MLNWIITILATVSAIFLISLLFYKNSDRAKFRKITLIKIRGYKVHHSVFGLILALGGLLISTPFRYSILEVGLGMYIGHIAEEMYFNKKTFLEAAVVFIEKV